MPSAAPKPCRHPGCGQLSRDSSGLCAKHMPIERERVEKRNKERQREYDKTRGTASQRGYTSKWQKARETFLSNNPLCSKCQSEGRVTPATIVDHIRPHKGDQAMFWDTSNWQPLCKKCHDQKTWHEDGGKAYWGRGG